LPLEPGDAAEGRRPDAPVAAPPSALRRLPALAGGAALCGLLSLAAAIAVGSLVGPSGMWDGPPMSDEPYALFGALLVAAWATGLGFYFMLQTLWAVSLRRALPLVLVATVGATALGALQSLFWSILGGLAAGVATMLACRSVRRWRIDPG
jgi:hypothetical protein